MKVAYTPGVKKPITISDRDQSLDMTIEEALQLHNRLGLAIMDAIKAKAQEARA